MPLRRFLLTTPLALLLAASAFGCRKPKTKPDPTLGMTSVQLLEKGEAEVKGGRMDDGRRFLRTIEEQLPATPEYPRAKILLADSYFFAGTPSYPEAMVEYQSFLNIFPRHDLRDYALYRVALCHYASIETAERDQAETRKALEAFQQLLRESPGSVYVTEAKAKVVQCWRRLAEHELMVGIYYVNTFHFDGAERRLKELLETYPEYVDRERAYFWLGEAMRRKLVSMDSIKTWEKGELARLGREEGAKLSSDEQKRMTKDLEGFIKNELARYQTEAKGFYQKLVESYPTSTWAARARDRLIEMGQAGVKEELDS